ncbi:MAG: amino acid adenylation domain-containing protein [Saprospiraceae bacterium]
MFGGEALSPRKLQAWHDCYTDCQLINMYGITETTVHVTYKKLGAEDIRLGVSNIGKSIPSLRCYLLDTTRTLSPLGVVGELYVAGAGVVRGYLNREELSAERFIEHPLAQDGKLYRTGDLAKWLPSGDLEYLGRIDSQVKIRGYRIETGEIETVLDQATAVEQCVVVARKDGNGDPRLIAYIVPENDLNEVTYQEVQQYLKTQLPEYMVPSVMIAVEEFPLTANGKINKKALPDPDFTALSNRAYVAPSNETEMKIAAIWSELLNIEKVGVNDDFFELGGHSLLATRVASAIRKKLQVEVKIADLFAYTTIASLSNFLLVEGVKVNLPTIVATDRPERIPLSYSQERLWFIDQLGGSVNYHMPLIHRFGEDLDLTVLEYAFQETVNRHEVLRTVFLTEDGEPYQSILPRDQWTLSYEEYPTNASADWLENRIESEVVKAFDMTTDHMVRARLIKLENGEHLLILVVHHIATDGWSQPIFFGELLESYEARQADRVPALKTLSIQYADYAIWERKYLSGDLLEEKMLYWETKLQGVEVLDFPTDFIRPSIQSMSGNSFSEILDKDLSQQLKVLSQEKGVTMFMLTLTIFKVLLYKYTGQADIAVGSAIANRTQAEVEDLIGFFVNTLTLRSDLADNPRFNELLEQVKTTTLEAYNHQEVPFEKIVDRLVVKRDMSSTPLFQMLFAYHGMTDYAMESNSNELPVAEDATEDMIVQTEEANAEDNFDFEVAKFDISFNVSETAEGLVVSIQYCTDLFLQSTIERMMSHFKMLTSSVVATFEERLDQLKMLSNKEEELLLSFNDTAKVYPQEETLLNLFAAQVAQSRTATAIVFEEDSLTYGALDEYSNQLAHHLRSQGVKKESLVCICLERSVEMIIGLLAILKAGGAYVPIDPDYPAKRIQYILEDTAADFMITARVYAEGIAGTEKVKMILLDEDMPAISQEPILEIENDLLSSNLAYVIYTSGSTGNPKGVMIQHDNLLNYLQYSIEAYQEGMEPFSFPLFTSFSFDLTQTSIYLTLLTGGTLTIENGREVSLVLNNILKNKAINSIKLTPAHASILEDIPNPNLKLAILGGDQLEKQQVENLKNINPDIRVINEYGPTEATIGCTTHEVQVEDAQILIGGPIANTQIYILDQGQALVPIGVKGEICIGGDGLARAYLDRPELTAEKFIPNPFSTNEWDRLYRTGDLGRWLPDGNIAYLRRMDDQVKVRGYRIELKEIEIRLQESSLVQSCTVITRKDTTGDQFLVAYIVPHETFDREGIRNDLKAVLPQYMLPSLLIELEELPLTANGKIDKKALPEPSFSAAQSGIYVAPRNSLEREIATIWGDLLGIEKVGVEDNFFELGGHSLMAIKLLSKMVKRLSINITVVDIFTKPTIASLAEFIVDQSDSYLLSRIEAMGKSERVPLSLSQERLWLKNKLMPNAADHISLVHRLNGSIDPEELALAFKAMIQRHSVLRTVFEEEGNELRQLVLTDVEWEMVYEERPFFKDERWLDRETRAIIEQRFDLSKDCLLRAKLIKFNDQDYMLTIVLHRAASDVWSLPLFFEELLEYYEAQRAGRPVELQELEISYGDFAGWQRTILDPAAVAESLAYWSNSLKNIAPIYLPIDKERPTIQTAATAYQVHVLSPALSTKIDAFVERENLSMFSVLLTAFKILLHKYAGQEDLIVGTQVPNRKKTELANLVGNFENTLAIRTQLSTDLSFAAYLAQVNDTLLAIAPHADVTFEQVIAAVSEVRDLSRHPIVQALLVVDESPLSLMMAETTESSYVNESYKYAQSNMDISIFARESAEGLQLNVLYAEDLFTSQRIEEMMRNFELLLATVLENMTTPIADLGGMIVKDKRNKNGKSVGEKSYTFSAIPEEGTTTFNEKAVLPTKQVQLPDGVVDLMHIAKVIEQSPFVEQAVVSTMVMESGTPSLVACIVMDHNQTGITPIDVYSFLKGRLPAHMLPVVLHKVSTLPAFMPSITATDWPNFEQIDLEVTLQEANVSPSSKTELRLKPLWQKVLDVKKVGVLDDFFALGGNDLQAAQLVALIREELEVELGLIDIFHYPNLLHLSRSLTRRKVEADCARTVLLKSSQEATETLFFVPGIEGNVMCYYEIGKHLEDHQNLYVFRAQGVGGEQTPIKTVEEMATAYIQEMQKIDPVGPYLIGGYSFGAEAAYEMVRQLRAADFEVSTLIVFDAYAPNYREQIKLPETKAGWLCLSTYTLVRLYEKGGNVDEKLSLYPKLFEGKDEEEQLQIIETKLWDFQIEFSKEEIKGFVQLFINNMKTIYKPDPKVKIDVPILLLEALHVKNVRENMKFWKKSKIETWKRACSAPITKEIVSGDHWTLLRWTHAKECAEFISKHLKALPKKRS